MLLVGGRRAPANESREEREVRALVKFYAEHRPDATLFYNAERIRKIRSTFKRKAEKEGADYVAVMCAHIKETVGVDPCALLHAAAAGKPAPSATATRPEPEPESKSSRASASIRLTRDSADSPTAKEEEVDALKRISQARQAAMIRAQLHDGKISPEDASAKLEALETLAVKSADDTSMEADSDMRKQMQAHAEPEPATEGGTAATAAARTLDNGAKAASSGKEVCRNYLNGRCAKGDKCLRLHEPHGIAQTAVGQDESGKTVATNAPKGKKPVVPQKPPSAELVKEVKAKRPEWLEWLKGRAEPDVQLPRDPARHESSVCLEFLSHLASTKQGGTAPASKEAKGKRKGKDVGHEGSSDRNATQGKKPAAKGDAGKSNKGTKASKGGGSKGSKTESDGKGRTSEQTGTRKSQQPSKSAAGDLAIILDESPSSELVSKVKARREEWIAWLEEQAGPGVQVVYDPSKHEAATCRGFLSGRNSVDRTERKGAAAGGGAKGKGKGRGGGRADGHDSGQGSGSKGLSKRGNRQQQQHHSRQGEVVAGDTGGGTVFHVTLDNIRKQDDIEAAAYIVRPNAASAGRGSSASGGGKRNSNRPQRQHRQDEGGASSNSAIQVVVKDLGTQRITEPPLSEVVEITSKASRGKQPGGAGRRRGGGRR